MIRPEFSLCLPCYVQQVLAPSLVEVGFVGPRCFVVNLIGIECPKWNTPEGRWAMDFTTVVLDEAADNLTLWVPIPNILNEFLFKIMATRFVDGDIWIGTEDRLSTILVNAGHARKVKDDYSYELTT